MTAVIKDPNPKWWLKSVPKENTWSDVNILRFLRHYQHHPILWNVRDPEYNNSCARLCTYNHIVELLNLSNVNVKECMKLVEWLKKKYLEEKEIKRSKCEKRPVWFEIINKIVKKVLDPNDDTHLGCCECCCACETSESTLSSDYQACKDCCADQNIYPPCEYYKSSDKDDEKVNPCNFEKVECYGICNDEVKVVLYNIGDGIKRYNSDCDCTTEDDSSVERNSDCDCKTEDSKGSNSSICACCKCDNTPKASSTSSSNDDDKSCSCQKSSESRIPSVSTVEQFCIQPMPEPSTTTSSTSSSSSKIVDEKKAGIFMDSQRFRGKRISLVDDYINNHCGKLEIIPPRLHYARCCCDSDFYPLQVEL